ncbi:MAG: DUF11 domain-containing protein, partial [Sphingobacteriales bacterium]
DPADPNQPGNPGTTGTDIPVTPVSSFVSWKSFTIPGSATTVRGGEEITYTINIRNTGNRALSNISVRDAIPANTQFVSAANGGTLVGNEVRFTGVNVAFGQTASVSFVVRVNADLTGVTQIVNVGYVRDGANPEQPTSPPNPTDPNQPGDPTTPGTVIPVTPNPDLTTTLTVSSSGSNGFANAGDVLTYTITVQNTGNVALVGINASGPVPNGTTFLSAQNGGTLNGSNVEFAIGALPVGQSTAVTYQVTVNNNIASIPVITNIVSVTAPGVNKASNRADIQTFCLAPTAPGSVTATNAQQCIGLTNTITVNNPDAAYTYRYYTQASGGTAVGEGVVFTTPVLSTSTTYYVEAVRTAGQCTSATRTAVDIAVFPVLSPPTVSVQSTTANSITFAWTPVAGATSYEYSVDNGATYLTPAGGATATTQVISELRPNQQVRIRVKLVSGAYAPLSNQPGRFPVISHKNLTERGRTGETFLDMRETGAYDDAGTNDESGVTAYGQPVSINEPMRPKSLPAA